MTAYRSVTFLEKIDVTNTTKAVIYTDTKELNFQPHMGPASEIVVFS